jgi:cell division protein ZapB
MLFETFSKLEKKVQQVIDSILLLKIELNELKEKNMILKNQINNNMSNTVNIEKENKKLKEEKEKWKDRLHSLLKKMTDV